MMSELDVVVLTHDIPEHDLPKGSQGAIVHCYEDGQGFEVEFLEPHHVLTLTKADIQLDRASLQTEVVELIGGLPAEVLAEVRDFATSLSQKHTQGVH